MSERRRAASRRNRSRSKGQERRIARWLGGERCPLSGGASRHTRGDAIRVGRLYDEAKGVSGSGGTNGYLWPVFSDLRPGVYREAGCYVVHSTMLLGRRGLRRAPRLPRTNDRFFALLDDTREKAGAEGKLPLVTVQVYRRRGFWLCGPYEVMREAARLRRRVLGGEAEEEGEGPEPRRDTG
jgi:hypothetical protein